MKIAKKVYIIIISLFILSSILVTKILNLDELWNYSFSNNIINGLIPYKDFNMITTPLSSFINAIPLLLINKLIVYRLTHCIYIGIVLIISNKILDNYKTNKYVKVLITILISLLLTTINNMGYNIITLILILLIMYYESKKDNNSIIPLLTGLLIVNKQNIGLIFFIDYIVIQIIKKNKNIIKGIIISLIPSLILVIYLLITNSFFDFFDQAILGILTFSNKVVKITPLIITICIITSIILITINTKNKNKELFIYSLTSFVGIYPLLDTSHLYTFIIPSIIFIVINFKIKDNNLLKISTISLLIVIFIISIINLYNYEISYKSKYEIYNYLPISEKKDNNIKCIEEYFKTNDAIILNYDAVMYNMPLNKYHKYYDLLLNGNLGYYGENIIEKNIENNKTYLMNENSNKQEIKYLKDRIKKKYNNKGTICGFNIYSKE